MQLRLLTWNLEWATTRSWRTPAILERLLQQDADIAVLTEAQLPVVQAIYPHVVHAGAHPMSGQPDGSKVVVASKYALDVVDTVGSPRLPPRNFVTVDVEAGTRGSIRVIGIVVRWPERTRFVEELPAALVGHGGERTVLAGDYNLAMTGTAPLEQKMARVLSDARLSLVTRGPWAVLADERPLIDHVAIGEGLSVDSVDVWPRRGGDDPRELTDHAGVSVTLAV